jgi:hypothetical protein
MYVSSLMIKVIKFIGISLSSAITYCLWRKYTTKCSTKYTTEELFEIIISTNQHYNPPSEILFKNNHVIHIKGNVKNIPYKDIIDAVDMLNKHLEVAIKQKQQLVIVWDGSDVQKGSFTQVLMEIKNNEHCVFVYVLSHTSCKEIRKPQGLETVNNSILSIIAGRGECYYDNKLLENIEDFNEIYDFDSAEMDKHPHIKNNLYKLKIKECTTNYRKTGQPYFSNQYGNLLLNVALTKLTGTKNIIYLGMNPVTIAEYDTYKYLWSSNIVQIILEQI